MSASEFPVDLKKVGIALGIIGSIYTLSSGWVTINGDVKKNTVRIENLEVQTEKLDKKMDSRFDKVMDKLDAIEEKVSNKQDRK